MITVDLCGIFRIKFTPQRPPPHGYISLHRSPVVPLSRYHRLGHDCQPVLALQELEPVLVPSPLLPLWVGVELVQRQVSDLEPHGRENLVSLAPGEAFQPHPAVVRFPYGQAPVTISVGVKAGRTAALPSFTGLLAVELFSYLTRRHLPRQSRQADSFAQLCRSSYPQLRFQDSALLGSSNLA